MVILTDQNNPRIVWGPHPTFQATNYKVYRAVSSTPLAHPELFASVIATVSGSIYEYKDIDFSLNGNDYLYYFVKGYNGSYSGSSNIGEVRGGMYKENSNLNEDKQFVFTLAQNYPNPFNPSTTINYTIAEPSFISLNIYDVLGNKIATLVNETKLPGTYEVQFDGSKISSGVYFYTLRTNDYSVTKMMLLTK